ncbi:hypothetical protein GCM10007938_39710 [Vibrio zhanjiangensis]|uniref:Uncharacterized protein n=1 Tax=Vibrio zhanjiangensis TaxID=1046128 RepID=A0ABQ6F3T7_9VIBR|nr:hypothetical protein GCM10007938_39710 [Vibrio zhanjiangensis]
MCHDKYDMCHSDYYKDNADYHNKHADYDKLACSLRNKETKDPLGSLVSLHCISQEICGNPA